MADPEGVVDVSEYASVLRRWWRTIAIAAVLGAVLGLLAMQLQNRQYETSAKVEVRPLISAGDSPNLDVGRQVNTDTERAIANSQRVTERALALIQARDRLGDADLNDPEVWEIANDLEISSEESSRVSPQIVVTAGFGTQILDFTAVAARPERARDLAQASALAYLEFRRQSGLNTTEQAWDNLIAREQQLLAELDDLAQAMANAQGAELQALSYTDISKREELSVIGGKLANLGAITVDPGVILTDAKIPQAMTGLPWVIGPMVGLVLGAVAGLAVAFLLDRRDDRVREPSVELSGLGVPMLGSVPVGRGWFNRSAGTVVAEVNSPEAEAYRRAQGSLLFKLDQADKSTVLVAGTNNPQSATTVAVNLAVAAARSGRRTLLIGADLRRPSMHERFGLGNDAGLSDVLTGQVPLAPSVQSLPDMPNLQILTAGSQVADPARLLQGEAFGRLVASARAEFDLVIFEAPPVQHVADAVDLARLCDGAVLVVEPDRATRSGMVDSVEQLRRVGAEVLGTVVAETTRA